MIQNRVASLLFTLFFGCTLFAQNKWQADIQNVTKEGYYVLALTPELCSKMKSDFSDLRIIDSTGKQIPYFIEETKHVTRENMFVNLPIESEEVITKKSYNSFWRWRWKNGLTRIVVENSQNAIIDNLSVIIKNSDAEKHLYINGSDDKKTWYTVIRSFCYSSSIPWLDIRK